MFDSIRIPFWVGLTRSKFLFPGKGNLGMVLTFFPLQNCIPTCETFQFEFRFGEKGSSYLISSIQQRIKGAHTLCRLQRHLLRPPSSIQDKAIALVSSLDSHLPTDFLFTYCQQHSHRYSSTPLPFLYIRYHFTMVVSSEFSRLCKPRTTIR